MLSSQLTTRLQTDATDARVARAPEAVLIDSYCMDIRAEAEERDVLVRPEETPAAVVVAM